MSKKGHQKGLLKPETIPSKPKDPFLLCHPHSSQVQRAYQGRKDPGFGGYRVKGSPGFSFFFFFLQDSEVAEKPATGKNNFVVLVVE